MRKLLIQGDSKSNLRKYLGLMQILVDDLHNREVKVLGELVYSYLQHRDKILDEEMLWEYVLGTGNRKKICEELEMEAFIDALGLRHFRGRELTPYWSRVNSNGRNACPPRHLCLRMAMNTVASKVTIMTTHRSSPPRPASSSSIPAGWPGLTARDG